jgi:hypothetical protein
MDRRVAVLIPAHNESVGIIPTIEDIKQQLRPGDRIVVLPIIALTTPPPIATSLGAEVSPRNDPTRIGKGYALGWGVDHLTADPPAIVIVIDADCRLTAVRLIASPVTLDFDRLQEIAPDNTLNTFNF